MSGDFYAAIPPFGDFERVADPAVYRPVPADWWVGVTDVVGSTAAIARGRYKAVNMAGAAAISAVMNALHHREFPFVFGGDGAGFAVPADAVDAARAALGRTATWVAEDLDLDLRVGLVPLADIRAQGRDVRVARFAASAQVSYAMVSGGGLAWAEAAVKRGRYAVDRAPAGARPDLAGLSCRWTPIESRRGTILSLLLAPAGDAADAAFADVIRMILDIVGQDPRGGHPVPERGPGFRWPPAGLELEALAARGDKPPARQRRALRLLTLIAWVLDKTGWKLGGFDPVAYRVNTALNTDFRKFDDALRMTVDCDTAVLERVRSALETARAAGTIRYGLHTQDAALMTCIVPSALRDDHMHFLDGADGGYARAAQQLKSMAADG